MFRDYMEEMRERSSLEDTEEADISSLIDYYTQIQDEIKRMEMSKEVAAETIRKYFVQHQLREFTTDIAKAEVNTRVTKTIMYKEAEALLAPDILGKLTKEKVSVILSVRRIRVAQI